MINNFYSKKNNKFKLYAIENWLQDFIKLYETNNFPKVLMLSGEKGIGKFTLTSHFLNYVFDKKSYDLNNFLINSESSFFKQFINNTFPNIIYLSGEKLKNLKIDEIRELKTTLLKSSILQKQRFIIFDDIELFNINCLNALLKIIEEPSKTNYFILINNKTRTLIETIYSRAVEINIYLQNDKKIKVIENLISANDINVVFEFKKYHLSPGSFLSFNKIDSISSEPIL